MNRMTLAALALAATPLAQAAPLVDVYAGGYLWNPETSGTIASGGGDIDVHDDLGFDDASQSVLFIGLEHPLPLLPNVRLRYSDLDDSGNNNLTSPITFDGTTFAGNVHSSYDMKMLDGTFYWSPLNNWIHLDLGVTVRNLDADFTIQGGGQEAHASVNQTFPLAHVATELELPGTGFYAGGEFDGVSYDGSHLTDYNLHLGWRSDFALGVELGYRRMELKLDDVDDIDSDLKLGGPYLAATLNF